jgi:hypothetical protein
VTKDSEHRRHEHVGRRKRRDEMIVAVHGPSTR